jgi:hypothetical protein
MMTSHIGDPDNATQMDSGRIEDLLEQYVTQMEVHKANYVPDENRNNVLRIRVKKEEQRSVTQGRGLLLSSAVRVLWHDV